MTSFLATNAGNRTVAIKVRGGSVSLRPNTNLPVEPYPDLDVEMISQFASLGVTFSVPGEALAVNAKSQKKAKRSASVGPGAEKAAADLAAAEKTVADAREMLDVVGDDMVAKAAAEDELKAAEAALASLKA